MLSGKVYKAGGDHAERHVGSGQRVNRSTFVAQDNACAEEFRKGTDEERTTTDKQRFVIAKGQNISGSKDIQDIKKSHV